MQKLKISLLFYIGASLVLTIMSAVQFLELLHFSNLFREATKAVSLSRPSLTLCFLVKKTRLNQMSTVKLSGNVFFCGFP